MSNSCCMATASQLATCSIPTYQSNGGFVASSSFCPTPPTVAVGSQETGALDSFNVFVAEHLLNVSEEVELALFFQQFAAGFVVHSPDPFYATCGDENENVSCASLAPALSSFEISPEHINRSDPISACLLESNDTMNQNCGQLPPANWSSSYNAYLEACIVMSSCGPPSSGTSLVGKQSANPPQPTKASATVWYNNQVRTSSPMVDRDLHCSQ